MLDDANIYDAKPAQPAASAGSPAKPMLPTMKVKRAKKTAKKGSTLKSALGVLSGDAAAGEPIIKAPVVKAKK